MQNLTDRMEVREIDRGHYAICHKSNGTVIAYCSGRYDANFTLEEWRKLPEKLVQRNKQIRHLKDSLELKRTELVGERIAFEGIIDTKNARIIELEDIVEEMGMPGFERTVPQKSEEKGQMEFKFKEGDGN